MNSKLYQSPWFFCTKPIPEARLRLFCFPYAGGSSAIFRRWSTSLLPVAEVYAVQLPGRASRLPEKPLTKMEPIVQEIAEVLPHYDDKPIAFFGHSLGALIAFEVARQLRRQGEREPVHLFASGSGAPQAPRREEPIRHLPQTALIEELKKFNSTPVEVFQNAELMALLLPAVRADFEVYETYQYRPEPPLSNSISAFGGEEDHRVSRDQLEEWRRQTSAVFGIEMFPSGHFFINTLQPLFLQTLSRELQTIVRRTVGT